MGSSGSSSEWQRLFEDIAIPRLAGSKNCDAVVMRLAGLLREKGYRVELQHFVAGPEGLIGGSVFGLLLALGSVIAAVILLSVPTAGWFLDVAAGLVVVGLVAALPAAIAALVANGRLDAWWLGTLLGYRFPTGPADSDAHHVTADNIIAVKGEDPRAWLVAHSDSKVQRNSLGTRMVVVWLTGVGALLLVSSGALHALGSNWDRMTAMTILGAALAVAGGTVLALAGLKDGSPGAVDNATGVVAVLAAAEALGWRPEVGILITGAEELAMAGAREWVKQGRGGNAFVNFDGVDGKGRYVLWVHKGASPRVAQSLASRLRDKLGRREAWIPKYLTFGMFVDGMILAQAGLAGVTVQRGTFLDTTAVAHTPKDMPSRVDIEGALRAGRAAASVIGDFLTESP
jgi:hypothetical protein